MYRDDSFFTLGLIEAAGLLAVTAGLVWGLLALARRFCRGALWRRLLRALILYWLFLWLSPQVHYAYYQLIFEGLPLQLVVGWPPGLEEVFRRLTFTGPATLAAHGQGVLGWALTVVAVRRRIW
ncbi:MAG TPA: hypothetical protein VLA52_11585 [Thermohalobaculum sp.]|nr:hypothetical protein [Thermohalobaculum sp.]